MSWFRFLADEPQTPRGVNKRLPKPTTGVYYDTKWARRPLAKFIRQAAVRGFMQPSIKIFGSPRVVGLDRLTEVEGPVIFAANHHSHADTTLLLAVTPAHLRRDLAPLGGADYFFKNKLSSAAAALFIGAIPIERQKLSKLSIANAEEAIDAGCSLLIFPEGGRSPDGWSRKHLPGAAFVAKRAEVPVVPVYIDGTGRILPKGKKWPSRASCAVVFGKPIRIAEGEGARAFAQRIEDTIAELADEFSSGWWEARRRAHASASPALHGPEAGAWRRRWALGPAPGQKRRSRSERRWPKQ